MSSPIYRRTELLLGEPAMELLAQKRVIIFGVGGVGSWCAESLVRSGIVHLTLVDSDRICVTNINRQLMATSATVGEVKVEALKRRLLEINPHADIITLQEIYSKETAGSFHLESYDYVIDAIDSLQNKADLILHATSLPVRFYSSMGAALKMDPTRIHVAEFWKVQGCPLGAALRRRFKRMKTFPGRKFRCVYSDELLQNRGVNRSCGTERCLCPKAQTGPGNPDLVNHEWCTSKAQINGTMAHITAIFGFMLAGLVLEDAVRKQIAEK
ncbi:MAG: tRNA threonylcarbamoyladenosine dehydratase [Paludibacteraceae bacterium]|nr:tRNA threonylcarbamoyladenosine dehydratase [Paludibacteraceae bacterium]